jgi:hypothetical protein
MKRGSVFVCIVAAVVGAFALGRAGAQEGNDMKAAFMALGKPGAEHAALMKCAGNWNCETKEFQPGAEPNVSHGKVVRTEVFGGRFLREDFEGQMGGDTFKGVGFTGFNNATKKYEMVWFSSMGTDIMFMTGTETEAGKAWEFKGAFAGPGGMQIKSRIVTRKIADDQEVMEMWNDMGMGEMKCMEITYTRAK